jgi:hypothetical protein
VFLKKDSLDDLVAFGCRITATHPFEYCYFVIQVFLQKESLDDLVALLTKARVVNRLLDFMPPSKRTLEDFNAHFR